MSVGELLGKRGVAGSFWEIKVGVGGNWDKVSLEELWGKEEEVVPGETG